MTKKAFDCVEMKRRGAELVRQRIAGMTPEQELEFWRKQTDELRKRQQVLQRGPGGSTTNDPDAG